MFLKKDDKESRALMAQRVQILLIDDVDGSEGAESITFALDGVTYEIDLSEANATAMRESLVTWVGHARRAGSTRAAGSGRAAGRRRTPAGGSDDTSAIREWARAHGHTVSDRGRISAEVRQAYAAAN